MFDDAEIEALVEKEVKQGEVDFSREDARLSAIVDRPLALMTMLML